MTILIEYLNTLSDLLSELRPSYFESLDPGLSRDEIDEIIGDLGLVFPVEFYEFYQWRNGTSFGAEDSLYLFYDYTFLTLEDSLELYKAVMEEEQSSDVQIWAKEWFPIFSCDLISGDYANDFYSGDYLCILAFPEDTQESNQDTSQIMHISPKANEAYMDHESLGRTVFSIIKFHKSGEYTDYPDIVNRM